MTTKVYFATNRNYVGGPTESFGQRFNNDNSLANLRFGEVSVDTDTEAHSGFQVYPESSDGAVLGSKTLFDYLSKEMKSKLKNAGDLIIFIHGFNVSFDEALLSAAKIKETLQSSGQPPLNVIAFSWPSDGEMFHYKSDRYDAAASGLAVYRGIEKLVKLLAQLDRKDSCDKDLHLIAHSMGTYVLRNALQELIEETPGKLPRIFDQIILAASDEDEDALSNESKLGRLPELCRRVNVYCNRNDRPLQISDWTKGNPDRLGSDGPEDPTKLSKKVSVIDTTRTVKGLVEHSYFIGDKTVAEDLREVLLGMTDEEIRDNLKQREFDEHRQRWRLKK